MGEVVRFQKIERPTCAVCLALIGRGLGWADVTDPDQLCIRHKIQFKEWAEGDFKGDRPPAA
jgi:hypothetical protein